MLRMTWWPPRLGHGSRSGARPDQTRGAGRARPSVNSSSYCYPMMSWYQTMIFTLALIVTVIE